MGSPAAQIIRYNQSNHNVARAGSPRRGALFCHRRKVNKLDEERKADVVMIQRVKGTTFIVNSFFNQSGQETAADKMARLIEREVNSPQSFTKI